MNLAPLGRSQTLVEISYSAGLDVKQRPLLLQLLHDHQNRRNPIIVLGLRQHDPIPDWITNVAVAHGDGVVAGKKVDLQQEIEAASGLSSDAAVRRAPQRKRHEGPVLVDVKGLNIAYSDRKVGQSIVYINSPLSYMTLRFFKISTGLFEKAIDGSCRVPMVVAFHPMIPLSGFTDHPYAYRFR